MSGHTIKVLSVQPGETLAQLVNLPLEDEVDSLAVSSAQVSIGGKELPRPVPVIVFSGNTFTGDPLTHDTGVSVGVSRDADDSSFVTMDDLEDVVAEIAAAGLDLDEFQAEVEEQLEQFKEVQAMRALVQTEIRAILAARQAAAEEELA